MLSEINLRIKKMSPTQLIKSVLMNLQMTTSCFGTEASLRLAAFCRGLQRLLISVFYQLDSAFKCHGGYGSSQTLSAHLFLCMNHKIHQLKKVSGGYM